MDMSIIAASRLRADKDSFISVWDTTKPGVTGSNSIRLPLEDFQSSTPEYKFNGTIFWGDGTKTDLVPADASDSSKFTHTYASSGIYTVKISGDFGDCFGFNNSGDKDKIIEIIQWGTNPFLKTNTNARVFYGCSNLICDNIKDVYLGQINIGMFRDCGSLVRVNNINDWPGALTTSIGGSFGLEHFFRNCDNAIIEIKDWRLGAVKKITGLRNFLNGNGKIPTAYYDDLLVTIDNDPATLNGKTFDVGASKYTIGSAGETARNNLINNKGWTINDGGGI